MLNKEPDQNNFLAWKPKDPLDRIERKAKAADRYVQRAVVHWTLGYFRDEEVTKESLTKERLAAVTKNLQCIFGEGIEWSRAQVMTWATNELNLVGNELLYYELKLSDYERFNEVRPPPPSPCRRCRRPPHALSCRRLGPLRSLFRCAVAVAIAKPPLPSS
eukprot:5464545-Prymnesium_polylepis.1